MHVAVNGERFQCATCSWGRHCDSANPAPFAKWIIPGVLESRTCLLPMVGPAEFDLIRLYNHWEKGRLPFAGGLLDQPHAFVEAMEIISAAMRDATTKDDG